MHEPTLLSHCFLLLAGADAPPDLTRSIERITVESSLHMPDIATLVIHDPQLRWLDAAELEPGAALEIWATVGEAEDKLFDGEVVEVEPVFSDGTQRFTVRAYDRLHRLAHGRRTRSFVQISDAELIQKLAAEVGLEAQIEGGTELHSYLMQANMSNLNFLRARAALLGQLLYVEGRTIYCKAPQAEDEPVELRWGADLAEFRPRLSTLGQVQRVIVRGWNPDTRDEITAVVEQSDGAPEIGEFRTGGDLVQAAFQISAEHQVITGPVRSQALADLLAQGAARRRAGQFVEAEGRCRGTPAIGAGATVQIMAVGDRFSGRYFVTAARHSYSTTGYRTEFHIAGLHPQTLLQQLMPQPQQTATGALVIGIVTDNADPNSQGRVKLRFPWLSGEHTSDWARIAVPGGGAERGLQWLPEIDDEVIVGFELGDLQHPYVLGGLWNGVDHPPRPNKQVLADGKVQQRLLRSRSGHLLVLDDSKQGGITIEDRNGNRLSISSNDNRIQLRDKNDNIIMLDAEKNSLSITVKSDIAVKAQGAISLEATGTLSLKGNGIQINGGAGTVDITGSLIKLN